MGRQKNMYQSGVLFKSEATLFGPLRQSSCPLMTGITSALLTKSVSAWAS